jgi:hypothetical protein
MLTKISKVIIILFVFISFSLPINANQNSSLYAYTTDTTEFDEYAVENIGEFIYGYYGYIDDNIKLGRGITVLGDIDNTIVIYPIWKYNEIIATFKVALYNNEYFGTYSDGNASAMNHVKEYASLNTPLILFMENEDFL